MAREFPKGRLTTLSTIYHQEGKNQPTQIDSRFTKVLETNEQLYERQHTATEEWASLDLGWIKKPSYILIQNREGQTKDHILSPEEQAELDGKILMLGFQSSKDFNKVDLFSRWLISPGGKHEGYTENANRLLIRCAKGTAIYRIYVIPN